MKAIELVQKLVSGDVEEYLKLQIHWERELGGFVARCHTDDFSTWQTLHRQLTTDAEETYTCRSHEKPIIGVFDRKIYETCIEFSDEQIEEAELLDRMPSVSVEQPWSNTLEDRKEALETMLTQAKEKPLVVGVFSRTVTVIVSFATLREVCDRWPWIEGRIHWDFGSKTVRLSLDFDEKEIEAIRDLLSNEKRPETT